MNTTKVNMDFLSDEFFADHNKEKRDIYTKFVNDYTTELRHQIEWREFIDKEEVYITFFQWYELYCSGDKVSLPDIYESPKITQEYKDIKSDQYVTTIHPPKTLISIEDKYIAKPLMMIDSTLPKEELTKDIIYQNNYSNEILNTIGQQLTIIDNRTLNITENENTINEKLKTICKDSCKDCFLTFYYSHIDYFMSEPLELHF